MQARLTTNPEKQVFAAIQALDLESVKARVMDAETGEGWTREYADGIEAAYRNYLTMLVKYQDDAGDIALSKDVDRFWHTHILDTMKYADDCQRVFGNFLHHNPHIGERTPADVERKAASMERTHVRYLREFGNTQAAAAAWAGNVSADKAAYCESSIRVDRAAYCESSIRADRAAYCEASVRADRAAYCEASVRADKPAYCEASVRAHKPAYCEASVRAHKPAYCEASVRAHKPAYCEASVRADKPAYCEASVRANKAAYCEASVRANKAAYCEASVRADKPAYCEASVRARTAVDAAVRPGGAA